MKILLTMVLSGALLALAGVSAQADNLPLDPAVNSFAVAATNNGGALSWAVVSARSGNSGTPAIRFLDVGSDVAAAKVSAYRVTAKATVTFTNSTVTMFVNNTNGFGSAGSDVIVIQHKSNDHYEKRILTSNSSSTNLVVTVAPDQTVVPGDTVFRVTTTGAPSVLSGVAVLTNTISAGGAPLLVGQQNLPLLIEINGTSGAMLYSAAGDYVPPVIVPRPGL